MRPLLAKLTFILLLLPVQRMSLYHFGDLPPYPYHYMPTPAASIPVLPTCSSSSSAGGSHRFCSPQPWLRFSPYLSPTSLHLKQKALSPRLSARSSSFSDVSKSGSRHSGPASDNAKLRTDAPKIINASATNNLQNIQNLMRGLDRALHYQ